MGRKGEMTKQLIRREAFDLFAENGYTKVSMQDICTKCGLSKGGLYRHYADKVQVFTDILRELQEEEARREAADIRQNSSAVDILNHFLDHIRQDMSKTAPDINIALYEFCLEHKEDIGAELLSGQYKKGEAILLSLMEYGRSRGEFCLTDPQGAAAAILFMIEGLRMTNEVMPIGDHMLADIFMQIRKMMGVGDEVRSGHE